MYFFLKTIQAFAQTNSETSYTPLQPLPGISVGDEAVTGVQYITGIFTLLVGAVTILAVIWIVLGGIQYMSTDAWSGKSEGKEKIKNALLGLLLAGASWLILYTINPELIDINLTPDTSMIIEYHA